MTRAIADSTRAALLSVIGLATSLVLLAAGSARAADRAVQLHGAEGVRVGSVVERLYREIRALRIYEGATEVQQLIIGRELLRQWPTSTPASAPA